MSKKTSRHPVLVLASLGVFVGLVLIGSATQGLSQSEKKDEASKDESGVYINVRPMKDIAAEAIAKLDSKEVDLDKPFKVAITGSLGLAKDGKTVILKNVKRGPGASVGEPATVKFVEESILAFADAGWLGYLARLDTKVITASVEQNGERVLLRVIADQPSIERARAAATGMRSMFTMAALQVKGDDETILNSATVGSQGTEFWISFALPNAFFNGFVKRKLASAAAGPNQADLRDLDTNIERFKLNS